MQNAHANSKGMTLDFLDATNLVEESITAEIANMNAKWGPVSQRTDILDGQFFEAMLAQADATFDRRNGEPDAFDVPPEVFPQNWSGFRDYGSDFANLAVIAAYAQQEMLRLAMFGQDTTRLSRAELVAQ
jgi:hypothetical protein